MGGSGSAAAPVGGINAAAAAMDTNSKSKAVFIINSPYGRFKAGAILSESPPLVNSRSRYPAPAPIPKAGRGDYPDLIFRCLPWFMGFDRNRWFSARNLANSASLLALEC